MKRNKFNMSFMKKFTCDMGQLIPCGITPVIPGDTFQCSSGALIRMAPLLAPLFAKVIVRMHHFFVQNRNVWEDFEDFITGGPLGTSTPTHPYLAIATCAEGGLKDYMGLPVATYGGTINFNALFHRGYHTVFNEYYRDQDLVSEIATSIASGADSTTPKDTVHNVSWPKNYSTTARPWETKGNAISIPLTGDAPVMTDAAAAANLSIQDSAGDPKLMGANTTYVNRLATAGSSANEMYAKLSSVTGVDINELKLALGLQEYQEARAQYGSRYVEYLKYLGVKSSDARLALPEYLGGGSVPVAFTEVLSTDGANTGDMKGHGIAAMQTKPWRKFFEEHGFIISLISVVPQMEQKTNIPRHWLPEVKEDYFQRELAHIGEQEITNKEIQAEHTAPDDIFGYGPRYDELRSNDTQNGIAGEFNSTLEHWVLTRTHTGDVSLNSSYVTCTPKKSHLAAPGTDGLYIQVNHRMGARRMVPARGFRRRMLI